MKKILVLHNIITPYRVHLFNEMANFYADNYVDFKVIFLSESDKNRHWNNFDTQFSFDVLENIAIRFGKKDLYTFFINKNIFGLLEKEDPDKIICFGWDHLAAYSSFYWSRKHVKEFIIWSGSTIYEKSWRRNLFNPLVKYLVRHSDKCIADGTRHRDYLVHLGAEPRNVEIFYFQVDVDYFINKSDNFSNDDKTQFKKMLGITTQKVIFFNGQLIERKGIFELLQGFRMYQEKHNDITLLILGRGMEKEKMQAIVTSQNIQNIVFADFVPYEDVYKFYSISDMLILPSREEAWGLVLNEAMACGLPIISTYETGAVDDLIEEGKNGYVIKSNCPECIEASINKLYENKLDKINNSRDKIKSMMVVQMIKESLFLRL